MPFNVTDAHQAIFDAAATGGGNIIIQAVAGSGKTATLGELTKRLYAAGDPGTVAYTSFAKRNVEDAKARFDARVVCGTMHSLGLKGITRASKARPRVDGGKVRKALYKLISKDAVREYGSHVAALVGAAKSQGLVPADMPGVEGPICDTPEAWEELIERFDLTLPDEKQCVKLARRVLEEGLRDLSTVDFDDMLYVPVVMDLELQRYDWLLVDEAQDLNPVQRAMISMLLTENGRLVAVGDSRQAIYAWRGADSDALAQIKSDFGCAEYPLSTSYRVCRAVEGLAREIVPHFRVHDDNAPGTVSRADVVSSRDFGARDLILCRNNAPLVKLAFRLIRERVPCQVLGRDLAGGLTAIVNRLKPVDLFDLSEKLNIYEDRETAKLLAQDREPAVGALKDKCDVLRLFVAESEDVDTMIREIQDFFADTQGRGKLTLSTVHKAKGGEADVVWILDEHLMPSRYAKTPEARLQEQNLMYVAYTRAKKALRFVEGDNVI